MNVIKAEKQFKHFKIIKVKKVRIILPYRPEESARKKPKWKQKKKDVAHKDYFFKSVKFCNNLFCFFLENLFVKNVLKYISILKMWKKKINLKIVYKKIKF